MARKQIFVRERDFKSYLPLHVPERCMYATRSMAELVAFRETSMIVFCGYPGHLSLSLSSILHHRTVICCSPLHLTLLFVFLFLCLIYIHVFSSPYFCCNSNNNNVSKCRAESCRYWDGYHIMSREYIRGCEN